MTKQSLLLRLDNALKELDEVRAELRAEAQAAQADAPVIVKPGTEVIDVPARDYIAAYEEYAAEPAPKTGDVQIRGKWYNTKDAPLIDGCAGCAFLSEAVCVRYTDNFCSPAARVDGRNIIFIKVE